MIIKRNKIQQLYNLLSSKGSCHFSINTQYKMLKIKKSLALEVEIYNQQINSLQDYFERDKQGNPIQESGGIKIKSDLISECNQKINEINETEITVPDLYFNLEELEPLNLTLDELELLEPFVKI